MPSDIHRITLTKCQIQKVHIMLRPSENSSQICYIYIHFVCRNRHPYILTLTTALTHLWNGNNGTVSSPGTENSSTKCSGYVYYLGWNRSPAQVGCMRQALGPGALGRPIGIGWRGRWGGGIGMGDTCKTL